MLKTFILLIHFIIISCSKTSLPKEIENKLLSILEKNQIIQESILESKIPDFGILKNAIAEAVQASNQNVSLKQKLEQLNQIISKTKNDLSEETFQNLSDFSIQLSEILVENQIKTEYNKFHCPMVSKYWVAKGVQVNNPYAPEMRDCGELVNK
jgi:dsDNA-specific endonuclease/ATPase MutS2